MDWFGVKAWSVFGIRIRDSYGTVIGIARVRRTARPLVPLPPQARVSVCRRPRPLVPIATGQRSSTAEFWTSASDQDLREAWHRLRLERHTALADADSTAPLMEAGGHGGLDEAALQVTREFGDGGTGRGEASNSGLFDTRCLL